MIKKVKLTAEQVKKIQAHKDKKIKLTEAQIAKVEEYFKSIGEGMAYKPIPKSMKPAANLTKNFKQAEKSIPGFKAESVSPHFYDGTEDETKLAQKLAANYDTLYKWVYNNEGKNFMFKKNLATPFFFYKSLINGTITANEIDNNTIGDPRFSELALFKMVWNNYILPFRASKEEADPEIRRDIPDATTESETMLGHPVAGKGGAEYHPQSPEENEKTFRSMNEGLTFELAEFAQHALELLKQILSDPSQAGLSTFWLKMGITRGELFSLMADIGLVTYVGHKLVVNVKNLTKKVKRFYHEIKERKENKPESNEGIIGLGDDIEMTEDWGNAPLGADQDSRAPWNQREPMRTKGKQPTERKYDVVFYDREMAILEDGTGELYFFYYDNIDKSEFSDFADIPITGGYRDEDGEITHEYGDWDIDDEVIERYVNSKENSIGTTYNDYEDGKFDLVKINPEIAADILTTWHNSDRLMSMLLSKYPETADLVLSEIEANLSQYRNKEHFLTIAKKIAQKNPEAAKRHPNLFSTPTESLVRENNFRRNLNKEGKSRKLPKADADYRTSTGKNKCEICMHFKAKSNNCAVVRGIVDKEMVCDYFEKKGKTDETTTAASSGAYVTPKVWAKSKKDWRLGNKPSYHPNGKIVKSENFSIKLTKNQVNLLKENFAKTQWPNGEFVEFDDCVKFNNNKKAQNGGCSVGAVDNVVKTKKSKGSVISKKGMFNEGYMSEDLKLQHDKANSQLVVMSTLQGKEASDETFRNKNVLRQNGFRWNGTAWVISADKMDVAKQTLSIVNKAEYLINTLEDLEEYIDGSGADNRSLIKAKLDQYIQDLANATDEKALSAEIRRYLTFFSKFHNYSFFNRILIYIQKPDATRVASYKKWQEKHRQVERGAKGITILAPVITKSQKPVAGDEEGEKSEVDIQNVTRFRAVKVFDISDTKAMGPEGEVPETPQWWGENTPSETADMLYDAVIEVAKYMGIDVTAGESKHGEKGYSASDHINISSDVAGVGRLATMIHEMGHELMHWKKSSIYYVGDDEGVRISSELAELQAESVSYVVLKHYGIPVTHQATYLALWKANKEKIQQNLEVISKVSQFIIDKIDEVMSSKEKTA